MPRRIFVLSDQAHEMLEDLYRRGKKRKKNTTYSELANEAIKLLALFDEKTNAEELFEKIIANRLERFENRIAGFIASIGIDVDMILHEILEQREAYEWNKNKDPKAIYDELRMLGVQLFNKKRAFQQVDHAD
ncbi:hypothetical protein [Alicyclobacillus fastidiosus]|uniref:hypothetical protein n=1 Tax=Alicyclobacillus fastidiosus TaxID=392011 RepID=UPI0023E95010|nr:hypothetical protein [Alicyclobacillus fastidiosus]GMA66084.1 hypothetical protein GCM10025859_65260 [Alicyclobacillus fastidiosus]